MNAVFAQADLVFKIVKLRKVDADTLKVRCVDKTNCNQKFRYTARFSCEVKAVMAI